MTEPTQDPPLPRALRKMVEELRDEGVPELDWDAMERRLASRLAAREAAAAPRPSGAFARAFAFAAAAAVIGLGVSSARGPSTALAPAPLAARAVDPSAVAFAPGEAGARGGRDLRTLRAGDAIEAGGAPVTFAQAGLVSWTLSPGGRAVVRSPAGVVPGHVLSLERGSIRAEVTPRDPAEGLVEPFAIEVLGTRVAVHGTAFTVTRVDAGIVVDVEHGTVAVGPVGHQGVTTGRILVGPSRASFSLDGGRTARTLARTSPLAGLAAPSVDRAPVVQPGARLPSDVPATRVEPSSPPHGRVAAAPLDVPSADHAVAAGPVAHGAEPVAPAAPAAVPAVEEPAAPAPAYLTQASIRSALGSCFARTYAPASASVQLRVTTSFKLKVRADGTIESAKFDPPLKPEFAVCAGSIMGGRFESGPDDLTIPLSFAH